jgi:hypothetical protein
MIDSLKEPVSRSRSVPGHKEVGDPMKFVVVTVARARYPGGEVRFPILPNEVHFNVKATVSLHIGTYPHGV